MDKTLISGIGIFIMVSAVCIGCGKSSSEDGTGNGASGPGGGGDTGQGESGTSGGGEAGQGESGASGGGGAGSSGVGGDGTGGGGTGGGGTGGGGTGGGGTGGGQDQDAGSHDAGTTDAASADTGPTAGCSGGIPGQPHPADVPWTRHTIDDSSQGADGVKMFDVNNDGWPDITTGWEEGNQVRVYLHPGTQNVTAPWPGVAVGYAGSVEDAVFFDLDDDGAVDVVSACEGEVRDMYVHWAPVDPASYLQSASWSTEIIPASENTRRWMFANPAQIDGRGGVDLIAGAKDEAAAIGWFEAPADPRILADWTWHEVYGVTWIMTLVAHDMDGDGDLDMVTTDRKGDARGVLWLESPGHDALPDASWPLHRVSDTSAQVMFMVLADLDQDGLLDIVSAVSDNYLLYFRRLSASPDDWSPTQILQPANTGTGKGVAVFDVDLDGQQDVVFSCEGANNARGVMWLSYLDAPTDSVWEAHDISGLPGVKFDRIETVDLDGDGDLDVITTEESDLLGVIWYENPTRDPCP